MALFEKIKFKLISDKSRQEHKNSDVENIPEPPFTEDRMNTAADERQQRISLLTARERELFLLLLQGFTLKESAKRLSVKYSTANTHMTGIYKKLQVNSRAEMIIGYWNTGVAQNQQNKPEAEKENGK